jgi:hypothetical protein
MEKQARRCEQVFSGMGVAPPGREGGSLAEMYQSAVSETKSRSGNEAGWVLEQCNGAKKNRAQSTMVEFDRESLDFAALARRVTVNKKPSIYALAVF